MKAGIAAIIRKDSVESIAVNIMKITTDVDRSGAFNVYVNTLKQAGNYPHPDRKIR